MVYREFELGEGVWFYRGLIGAREGKLEMVAKSWDQWVRPKCGWESEYFKVTGKQPVDRDKWTQNF